MKRRGFLQSLFGAAAAPLLPTVAPVITKIEPSADAPVAAAGEWWKDEPVVAPCTAAITTASICAFRVLDGSFVARPFSDVEVFVDHNPSELWIVSRD